jgi:hypothetical protein
MGPSDSAGEVTVQRSGAFAEASVFLRHFDALEDPRQAGKVVYSLDEVLLLCLLAVLAGAETIVDIARFGEKERELLRQFRPSADGTPSLAPPTPWDRSSARIGRSNAQRGRKASTACIGSWT